jgi:hypothetical protein
VLRYFFVAVFFHPFHTLAPLVQAFTRVNFNPWSRPLPHDPSLSNFPPPTSVRHLHATISFAQPDWAYFLRILHQHLILIFHPIYFRLLLCSEWNCSASASRSLESTGPTHFFCRLRSNLPIDQVSLDYSSLYILSIASGLHLSVEYF